MSIQGHIGGVHPPNKMFYENKWFTYCKSVFAHFNVWRRTGFRARSKLLRIVAFSLSAYVPMIFRIRLNLRAPEGPTNIVFLRDLLLDFEVKDQDLAETALKNVFVKHFVAWMNPTNVALNARSKHSAFHLSCLKNVHHDLPEKADTHELAWKRKSLRCFLYHIK